MAKVDFSSIRRETETCSESGEEQLALITQLAPSIVLTYLEDSGALATEGMRYDALKLLNIIAMSNESFAKVYVNMALGFTLSHRDHSNVYRRAAEIAIVFDPLLQSACAWAKAHTELQPDRKNTRDDTHLRAPKTLYGVAETLLELMERENALLFQRQHVLANVWGNAFLNLPDSKELVVDVFNVITPEIQRNPSHLHPDTYLPVRGMCDVLADEQVPASANLTDSLITMLEHLPEGETRDTYESPLLHATARHGTWKHFPEKGKDAGFIRLMTVLERIETGNLERSRGVIAVALNLFSVHADRQNRMTPQSEMTQEYIDGIVALARRHVHALKADEQVLLLTQASLQDLARIVNYTGIRKGDRALREHAETARQFHQSMESTHIMNIFAQQTEEQLDTFIAAIRTRPKNVWLSSPEFIINLLALRKDYLVMEQKDEKKLPKWIWVTEQFEDAQFTMRLTRHVYYTLMNQNTEAFIDIIDKAGHAELAENIEGLKYHRHFTELQVQKWGERHAKHLQSLEDNVLRITREQPLNMEKLNGVLDDLYAFIPDGYRKHSAVYASHVRRVVIHIMTEVPGIAADEKVRLTARFQESFAYPSIEVSGTTTLLRNVPLAYLGTFRPLSLELTNHAPLHEVLRLYFVGTLSIDITDLVARCFREMSIKELQGEMGKRLGQIINRTLVHFASIIRAGNGNELSQDERRLCERITQEPLIIQLLDSNNYTTVLEYITKKKVE